MSTTTTKPRRAGRYRTMRDRITSARKRVLEAIWRHTEAHGFAPSLPEISAMLGLHACEHVERLERAGLIRHDEGKARTITITADGMAELLPRVIFGDSGAKYVRVNVRLNREELT